MRCPASFRALLGALLLAAGTLCFPTESFAQDETSLEDLRSRIEALEHQNADLLEAIEASGEQQFEQSWTDRPTKWAGEISEEDGWYEVGSDVEFQGSWNHGLEFSTPNNDFRVHIGGRTQFDTIWFDDSPAFIGTGGAEDSDAFSLRRARLRIDGTMYEWIEWAAEYDFANSTNANPNQEPVREANTIGVPAPTDLWLNFQGLPIAGNLRAGIFKDPIGMEHLTSSRFLPFLERSFNQDAFYAQFSNGFVPGLMLWDTYLDQRGIWATGVFKTAPNVFGFNVGDGEYAWTSRLTYLPWYDEASGGRSLLHLGISGSVRDPDAAGLRYRARPSLRNGPAAVNPVFADTGLLQVDDFDLLGLEAALNYGPLNVQAEWTGAFNSNSIGTTGPFAGVPVGTAFFHGYYVQALYFLTGEHMQYDRSIGVFGRVIPFENAYILRGLSGNIFTKGAWQVGARYSRLDLRDTGIDGGIVQDVTLGLNWYLNPNLKFQGNYVLTDREAGFGRGRDGDIHGFGVRLAHDF